MALIRWWIVPVAIALLASVSLADDRALVIALPAVPTWAEYNRADNSPSGVGVEIARSLLLKSELRGSIAIEPFARIQRTEATPRWDFVIAARGKSGGPINGVPLTILDQWDWVIATRRGFSVSRIADLANVGPIAITNGLDSLVPEIRKIPGIKLVEVPSAESAMQMLKHGRVNAVSAADFIIDRIGARGEFADLLGDRLTVSKIGIWLIADSQKKDMAAAVKLKAAADDLTASGEIRELVRQQPVATLH